MKIVVKSLISSACTITPGRGRPNSLGTTISTMSPRFTSTRSSRMPLRSRRRWHRFPDAAPSALPVDAGRHEPSDRVNPGPNAVQALTPVHASVSDARPFADARYEVNSFGSSLEWSPYEQCNMLRCPFQVERQLGSAIHLQRMKAFCGMLACRLLCMGLFSSFLFARPGNVRPDPTSCQGRSGAVRLSYPPSARQ